jgi:hypothetical protein
MEKKANKGKMINRKLGESICITNGTEDSPTVSIRKEPNTHNKVIHIRSAYGNPEGVYLSEKTMEAILSWVKNNKD